MSEPYPTRAEQVASAPNQPVETEVSCTVAYDGGIGRIYALPKPGTAIDQVRGIIWKKTTAQAPNWGGSNIYRLADTASSSPAWWLCDSEDDLTVDPPYNTYTAQMVTKTWEDGTSGVELTLFWPLWVDVGPTPVSPLYVEYRGAGDIEGCELIMDGTQLLLPEVGTALLDDAQDVAVRYRTAQEKSLLQKDES